MTVDNEQDVVFCLREVLEKTELFEVGGFKDPQLALSGFRPSEYDLVILDTRMPKLDGLDLYRK
jgi:DNA-binding response OmpR family regulator